MRERQFLRSSFKRMATTEGKTAGAKTAMIELPYSLVIEATSAPDFFGFYSDELEGFSGVGQSVEDCLYRAKWAMKEHLELLVEQGLPPPNPDPVVTIRNERQEAA
jgi:predicted RNase H-like HicB family nuclease